jgi:Outer membrane protein beta-barrel domain
MSSRILITVGLLATACVIPTQAQDQEEEGKLNVSMGGGLSVPLNPTARFAGVGGAFSGGGGYNIDQHNSIVGQFNWDGLPPQVGALAQLNGGSASINLYDITADYKYRGKFGKTFGYYLIAGGGWYYRHASVSKSTFIPTDTVCQPVWNWYGYTCSDGFVNTTTVGAGTSSFGANGGVGLTIKVRGPWKFYVESRYTYAASRYIATQVAPVIFGFQYQ